LDLNVCVVGTVFIDCKGFSFNRYYPDGRNLGDISFVHGGVGRNVADNLARLELPVTLVSSVDKTAMGKEVIDNLKQKQIDTSYIMEAANDGMGMWLAIIDNNGDLVGSISKMPDLKLLEKLIDEQGRMIIDQSTHVVLELDLNEQLTRNVLNLCKEAGKPIYGIPGNLDIVKRNLDLLPELECFICNDFEAGQIINCDLGGIDLEEIKDLLVKNFFTEKLSAKYTVVTLGSRGSIYHDSNSNITGYQEAIPTDVIDTSGAGDAFFSGTVAALIRNLTMQESAYHGSKIASWTISCSESICYDLKNKAYGEDKFLLL